MERNAMSAGFGSLMNLEQIKVLICYILSSINEPVDEKELAMLFHMEGIANYFEIVNAAEELVEAKNIAHGEDNSTIVILPLGRSNAKELETLLPFTIKNRAYRSTLKMISRLRNAKDCRFEYSTENDCDYLTCSAVDNDKTLMSIKIMVCDEVQAKSIEDRFIDNPAKIYSGIIDILTGTYAKRPIEESDT